MTQGELEGLAIPIQQNMSSLESRIMTDIVRRIKINGEITSTADWQMNRLYQMGMSKKEIKKAIAEALEMSEKDMKNLYRDALQQDYIRNQELYTSKGKRWIPFDKNEELQSLINGIDEQTRKELKNITQSLGFAIRGPTGKIIQSPVLDFYQDTLDGAMMDIATGAFDYTTVINRTVQTMTNSGLRSIDYDSGHSNRVEVAARRAIMTGFSQLQAKINEQVAKDLKTDYFEVSWHGGARPEHQVWQGRVYSRKQLETVCGLGAVTGLCGANCYHQYNAFIPGVSVRTYTDDQLEQMNAEENKPRNYNGKEYTKYEALQQQRKMETLMRKQRQDIKLLKDGGADKETIQAAKSRYRTTMDQYAKFSDKMKLPQQRDRIYMDGLGRMMSGKEGGVTKPPKDDIIKSNKSSNWSGLNYKQNYTKKSAVEHLKSEYGIKFSDSRKYPMDEKLLADCVGWMDSFTSSFPGFSKQNPVKLPEIKCQAPSKMHNAVGYYSYYTGTDQAVELALNGRYHGNITSFQDYINNCIKTKWYPENATTHKTFVHEYGHYVSHSMSCFSKDPKWQHGFIQECIDDYNKSSGGGLKSYKDCADLVSRYGASSDSELFAEAFAEYFGGENPREFAQIFGRKLEKQLKGVK